MNLPKQLGNHYILDFYNCDVAFLNQLTEVEAVMTTAVKEANLTIVHSHFHQFAPQGVSGTIIIAESHFSVHTWPEYGFASLDLFSCQEIERIDELIDYLVLQFGAQSQQTKVILRGTETELFI